MIRLRDERGVLRTKTVSFVALLSLLDRSCIIDALDDEAERRYALPPLPPRALLVDAVERPRASSIVLTGYLDPASRPFVLSRSEPAAPTAVSAVVPLPSLVYRAEWYRRDRTLRTLSIAVCSPDLSGPPKPNTPLFRFPLSNVYGYHSSTSSWGNRPGAVCWPSMGSLGSLELDELPERALIRGFLSVANNADLFGRGVSHNGPHADYAAFLEDLDGRESFPRDWLIPTGLTVRDLHAATG
ncbi:MAG: prokaryotic E2 ligase family D protein [Actinomycetota bacterium]|nr:prokaryotic E2 ligase family D protein [Actinomycetota bacterium]